MASIQLLKNRFGQILLIAAIDGLDEYADFAERYELGAQEAAMISAHSVGRMLPPAEVGRLIAWIQSEAAGSVDRCPGCARPRAPTQALGNTWRSPVVPIAGVSVRAKVHRDNSGCLTERE